jgi:hypothetical protein
MLAVITHVPSICFNFWSAGIIGRNRPAFDPGEVILIQLGGIDYLSI